MTKLFERFDVVATPTRATVSYPADKNFEDVYPGISGGPPVIAAGNLTGLPALARAAGPPVEPAGTCAARLPGYGSAAVTTTSIFHCGLASWACTVARGGASPGSTQSSQIEFIAAKSAMSAR